MVEEARVKGRIEGTINSTFIALIPKQKGLLNFNDYEPISLCNTMYKIISKVIAERLKGVLSKFIIAEQSGFLKNRSIHDAVAATQEIIHTIQGKKREAVVMKIDLNKAYDRVDWTFMRLILFKIGMDAEAVKWIMSCISNTTMAIIINGMTTNFVHPSRGLRQGCSLSPLLFILMMDALSIKIKRAAELGSFKGINIGQSMVSTHNILVDDILFFGML